MIRLWQGILRGERALGRVEAMQKETDVWW